MLASVQANALGIARQIGVQVQELDRVLEFGAKEIARRMKLDFQRTTQTWEHRPEILTSTMTSGATIVVTAGTNDEIFGYVDRGTPGHWIGPKRAGALAFPWDGPGSYQAKTRVRVLKSFPGGTPSGSTVLRRVWHPGTKAREFTQMIREKYDKEAPRILERYVRAWGR